VRARKKKEGRRKKEEGAKTVLGRFRAWLYETYRIVAGVLREIADERAYERHLAWQGRPHSPDEWRRFWEQRLHARYVRPKCC
jgi:hypothetical protein